MTEIVSYPIDVLTSFHYFHYFRADAERMARLHDQGMMRFIADSGAFSAHQLGATINIGEYAAWCRQLGSRLHWCASLDVIGDPRASWTNWTLLRDRHNLLTVPTLHAGTNPVWLDAYAKEGVDPETVRRSGEYNRKLIMQLAIGSAQRYATWLQQRHQVAAPAGYHGEATTGLRIYVVSSKIGELTAAVAE